MRDDQVKRVIIDCFPESARGYRDNYTMVAIDVIRATTTAITAAACGRKCFPVSSIKDALSLASKLDNPLLAGELGGNMPYGFHMTNSPAEIDVRRDNSRPMILLSSAGTQLICEAQSDNGTYLACFRNYIALARYLSVHCTNVAVIGAGTRGEFREEDQMCCAWIAEFLLQSGFAPVTDSTVEIVKRWKGARIDACLVSKSVEYLRKSWQIKDLDFILGHINDLNSVFQLIGNEVVMLPYTARENLKPVEAFSLNNEL